MTTELSLAKLNTDIDRVAGRIIAHRVALAALIECVSVLAPNMRHVLRDALSEPRPPTDHPAATLEALDAELASILRQIAPDSTKP